MVPAYLFGGPDCWPALGLADLVSGDHPWPIALSGVWGPSDNMSLEHGL